MDEKIKAALSKTEQSEFLANLEKASKESIRVIAENLSRYLLSAHASALLKNREEVIPAVNDFINAIAHEIVNDETLQQMTVDEALKSGAFQAAVDKTSQRLLEEATRQSNDKDLLLVSVGGRRVKDVAFPIDKVNANIWQLLEQDMGGQIAIAAERKKSKKQLNIFYSIRMMI